MVMDRMLYRYFLVPFSGCGVKIEKCGVRDGVFVPSAPTNVLSHGTSAPKCVRPKYICPMRLLVFGEIWPYDVFR